MALQCGQFRNDQVRQQIDDNVHRRPRFVIFGYDSPAASAILPSYRLL